FRAAVFHLGALFDALAHLLVGADAFALLGAPLADLRAKPTGQLMYIRSSREDIGARRADVRTVEQERDVRRLGMPAATLKAVSHRLQADSVAGHTFVDALL